ncbi:MAG: tetratricopeptide repeat protein [Desulfovibrionaceae bacterium]
MNPQTKVIKEHIARAKSYAYKYELLKTLSSLCEALELTMQSKVFGRDKFEISILVDEVLRILTSHESFKELLPAGISFKAGQEKALYMTLKKLHDRVKDLIEKQELEKTREKMHSIDQLILEAQGKLDEKEYVEARRMFYKVTERFEKEIPGLNVDAGQRMIRAGQFVEAIPFLERSIELDPKDPRPWGLLVACYEAQGELDKAVEVIKEVMRRHGTNESIFLRYAKVLLKQKKWGDAFDACQEAMKFNPFSPEAHKIADKIGPRVFGQSYASDNPYAPDKKAPAKPAKGG